MKSDLILQNMHFNLYLSQIKVLEKERIFCHHDLSHLLEVKRIMLLINEREQLNIDSDLIVACALLHDYGRVAEYTYGFDHRVSGLNVISNILQDCGYNKDEISMILLAIESHKNDSNDKLSSLLYRADKLSRNCYECDARDECYWDENLKNKERYK